MVRVILLAILLALAATRPAYAYIDPGTASIALQAVIGAIAVGGFYFRSTIAKVLGFMRPGTRENSNETLHGPAEPAKNDIDDS